MKLAKTTYPSQVPSSLCFQAVLRMKLNLDATLNILASNIWLDCVQSSHNYTLRFTIRVTIATKHNTAVAHSLRAVFEVAFWRNLCVIFWERPFDVLNHVSHLWCEALQDKLKSFITATTTFTFVQQDWEYVGSRVSFLLIYDLAAHFLGAAKLVWC